jgi:drug/metabolite transporter (DMT)-like permease
MSLFSARLVLQTAAAMVAFAANSLLCRIALVGGWIDAPTFASVRIGSGALLLAWLVRGTARGARAPVDRWAVLSLAAYLLPFTLAYLTLDAGSGALLLFGSAQLTMLGVGLYRGERCSWLGWVGMVAAAAGFVTLLAPTGGGPRLGGAMLMTIAGIAWGVYSLRGHASRQPLVSTAQNFAFVLPWALAINLLFTAHVHVSAHGVALAAASGMLASALGYILWYAALPRLTAISAGTVQLSVPVIAAIGGIIVLDEQPTRRLAICAVAILGGIALVARQRYRPAAVTGPVSS